MQRLGDGAAFEGVVERHAALVEKSQDDEEEADQRVHHLQEERTVEFDLQAGGEQLAVNFRPGQRGKFLPQRGRVEEPPATARVNPDDNEQGQLCADEPA